MGAVSLSCTDKINPRTKHIDLRYHDVRSLVKKAIVDVHYIRTDLQKGDILTKRLGAMKFLKSNCMMLMSE